MVSIDQTLDENKEMNKILEAQEAELELLRAALELSEVGFNISDAQGIVLVINPSQSRITGHPPEKTIGRSMLDIERENNNKSATMKVIETKKPITIEQILPSGKSYLVYGQPYFDKNGELKYVINNLVDNTEHNYMLQELETTKSENIKLEKTVVTLQEMVGAETPLVYTSPIMQRLVNLCDKIASFDSTILLLGQSGVGKEVISDYIQKKSTRWDKKFIKINCAAIPENLLESELFGYEPGAFTNASSQGKKGIFEVANKGTVMLDEIGELPLHLQTKLLRVIQDGEFYHVGGTSPIYTDVRIIAATNSNLEEMINKGAFRKDLYYRLSVIQITVPALSERIEDVPLLIHHFLNRFNAKYNVHKELTSQSMELLRKRTYEGNVRELQNVVERLVLLSHRDIIGPQDIEVALNQDLTIYHGDKEELKDPEKTSLKTLVSNYERDILQRYWNEYQSASAIAKALNANQPTISRKLHDYGILGKKELD